MRATRTDLTPALKEGGQAPLRRFRRLSLRNLLVVSQVSASLALLLITGFLVIGHRRMRGSNMGFDTRNLYMLSLDPVRDGYSGAQAAAFFSKVLDRGQGLPSVASATLSDNTPMEMIGRPQANFTAPDARRKPEAVSSARRFDVGRDFFDTMRIPILRGRGFAERMKPTGRPP